MQQLDYDLVVIGGGPAGLSAAINGASEGLRTAVLDGGVTFGGQARESSAIENYPGFPSGITGDVLMNSLVHQAYKFRSDMICPLRATRLVSGVDKRIIVETEDFTEFHARAVILALGLSYRRHAARNLSKFLQHGVYYGLPNSYQHDPGTCTYVVVGGANSAGQAVVHLAKNPEATIYMVIRKSIRDRMSQYLIDRIEALPNVRVVEGAEVIEVDGDVGRLAECRLIHADGTIEKIPCKCMFIFIGAEPRTQWLQGVLELDARRYICTFPELTSPGFSPLPFETSMRGVFACGDVRRHSTKRVAAAVGEGATALQMTHQHFSREE